jgi:phage terminase small subunit
MPKPRKPVEQKRRLGNPGKRPLPGKMKVARLASVEGAPEPSRTLGDAGRLAWDAAWSEACAWLSASDAHSVLMYAEAVDDYVQLRDSLYRRGFDEVTLWRIRKQVQDLAKQVSQLAGDLGLSPASRAQLGVAEVSVSEGFLNLMNRSSVFGSRTVGVEERASDH